MSSGNVFGQEHQFQSRVVYAAEMQSLNEKFERLHFHSVNHPGLELVFLSKNVTRGFCQFEAGGRGEQKMRTLCTLSRHCWCIAIVSMLNSSIP